VVKGVFEQQNMIKSLYDECIKPVCVEYGMATIELDILLFLANNPDCCTATDIVNLRKMTKSHVSAALKGLSERGFVDKEYKKGNRKTIFLKINDAAAEVIAKGQAAQCEFTKIVFGGFSESELEAMRKQHERISDNVKEYFHKGKS